MRTMFDMGFKKVMGQYSYGWPNPYLPTQPTPSVAPAVPPAPPALPPEVAKVVDDATRADVLSTIKTVRGQRDAVASWWQANPNAREILGNRITEYSQYLSDSMAQDALAETLEWRFSQGGEAYVKDSELAGMDQYKKSTQDLYDLVFGKPGDPGVAKDEKAIVLPGVVAAGAFLTAALL